MHYRESGRWFERQTGVPPLTQLDPTTGLEAFRAYLDIELVSIGEDVVIIDICVADYDPARVELPLDPAAQPAVYLMAARHLEPDDDGGMRHLTVSAYLPLSEPIPETLSVNEYGPGAAARARETLDGWPGWNGVRQGPAALTCSWNFDVL